MAKGARVAVVRHVAAQRPAACVLESRIPSHGAAPPAVLVWYVLGASVLNPLLHANLEPEFRYSCTHEPLTGHRNTVYCISRW